MNPRDMMSCSTTHNKLVDDTQVEKAITSLRKYESLTKKEKADILSIDNTETEVKLEFSVRKIAPTHNTKMIKIPLINSIMTENMEVCLLVGDLDKKDRKKIPDTIEHHQAILEKAGITSITEIIPVLKLKLEYQPFETKRALASRFDLFLAEDKIVRFLPSYLGKAFYGNKKHPVQVKLDKPGVKNEVEKVLSSTHCLVSGKGNSNSVLVARTNMTDEEILANVQAAIKKICEAITGGEDNIRSVHLKTKSSPSLPLYINLESRVEVKLPAPVAMDDTEEPEDVSTITSGLLKVTRDGNITIHKPDGSVTAIGDPTPRREVESYLPGKDRPLRGRKPGFGDRNKKQRKQKLGKAMKTVKKPAPKKKTSTAERLSRAMTKPAKSKEQLPTGKSTPGKRSKEMTEPAVKAKKLKTARKVTIKS